MGRPILRIRRNGALGYPWTVWCAKCPNKRFMHIVPGIGAVDVGTAIGNRTHRAAIAAADAHIRHHRQQSPGPHGSGPA